MNATVEDIFIASEGGRKMQRVAEVEAVAQAEGFHLDDDVVATTMDFCAKMTPDATSSMQRDVAAGRRLEYDAINGAVVRAGKETGLPTPVYEFCWTCLKVVDSTVK